MLLRVAQAAVAAVVLARLGRGRRRRPPLTARRAERSISVVIPARDESARLPGCLAGLAGDPDVLEVVVVDDRSSDDTAAVARAHGARVVAGRKLPPGWVGKPWALQQGLEAAVGEVVVCLDADTRPRPGLVGALDGALADADFVTAGARFACDGAGERLLHPSMLASLVYRYGPVDTEARVAPGRLLSNGQVTAVERERLLEAGGYAAASGHMTDDAALARALAGAGWRVAFVAAPGLVEVRMYESAAETWREWGRSIALADVTTARWQAADLAVVWLGMALPVLRLVAGLRPRNGVGRPLRMGVPPFAHRPRNGVGRPLRMGVPPFAHRPRNGVGRPLRRASRLLRTTRLDIALLLVRLALLGGLAGSYTRRGVAFWLSPLADPATAVRLTLSTLRPARTWRGRTYPR